VLLKRETLTTRARISVYLVLGIAHRFEALGQRKRVAVVAPRRNLVASGCWIPGRFSPLDSGSVTHGYTVPTTTDMRGANARAEGEKVLHRLNAAAPPLGGRDAGSPRRALPRVHAAPQGRSHLQLRPAPPSSMGRERAAVQVRASSALLVSHMYSLRRSMTDRSGRSEISRFNDRRWHAHVRSQLNHVRNRQRGRDCMLRGLLVRGLRV